MLNLDESSNGVLGFEEKAKEDGGWINGGFMVAQPELFNYVDASFNCVFEQEPMKKICADGQMQAYKHTGFWQCMDTQRDKSRLELMWNQKSAPWKLWG